MICNNCGTQCPDGTAFCTACGASLGAGQPTPNQGQVDSTVASFGQNYQQQAPFGQTQPQSPYGQGYQQQNPYGQSYQQPDPYGQSYQQQAPYGQPSPLYNVPTLPLKWHHFLVYFALWAGAIFNVIGGIGCCSGTQYEGYASMVYGLFPALKAVDIIYGILSIGLGVFGFYVAYSLLKFKQGAPKLLMIQYAAAGAVQLIYLIGLIASLSGNSYIDLSSSITSEVTSIIISVLMIFANKTYYNKRDYLFVN